ncbi:hypothetical protein T439DRAFT_321191 [Meredithblackwellia eburnea MCA 4105]
MSIIPTLAILTLAGRVLSQTTAFTYPFDALGSAFNETLAPGSCAGVFVGQEASFICPCVTSETTSSFINCAPANATAITAYCSSSTLPSKCLNNVCPNGVCPTMLVEGGYISASACDSDTSFGYTATDGCGCFSSTDSYTACSGSGPMICITEQITLTGKGVNGISNVCTPQCSDGSSSCVASASTTLTLTSDTVSTTDSSTSDSATATQTSATPTSQDISLPTSSAAVVDDASPSSSSDDGSSSSSASTPEDLATSDVETSSAVPTSTQDDSSLSTSTLDSSLPTSTVDSSVPVTTTDSSVDDSTSSTSLGLAAVLVPSSATSDSLTPTTTLSSDAVQSTSSSSIDNGDDDDDVTSTGVATPSSSSTVADPTSSVTPDLDDSDSDDSGSDSDESGTIFETEIDVQTETVTFTGATVTKDAVVSFPTGFANCYQYKINFDATCCPASYLSMTPITRRNAGLRFKHVRRAHRSKKSSAIVTSTSDSVSATPTTTTTITTTVESTVTVTTLAKGAGKYTVTGTTSTAYPQSTQCAINTVYPDSLVCPLTGRTKAAQSALKSSVKSVLDLYKANNGGMAVLVDCGYAGVFSY